MLLRHLRKWGQNCFNRYMVECEFVTTFKKMGTELRFNRYMVECE